MLYTQSDSTRCVVDRISLILRTTDRVARITVPNKRPLRPPLLCVPLPPRRRITSLGNTLDDLLLLPTSWHHGGIAFRAWHSFMCRSSFRQPIYTRLTICASGGIYFPSPLPFIESFTTEEPSTTWQAAQHNHRHETNEPSGRQCGHRSKAQQFIYI